MFKVLIGYDGSTCASTALTELQRAGLPEETEANVLAITDIWLPPAKPKTLQAPSGHVAQILSQAYQRAQEALTIAQNQAQEAAAQLRTLFPTWHVYSEAIADSPAWGIIKKAEERNVDLVVVGSRGVSAIDRVLLGSISQMVATHCTHSVRIGRKSSVIRPDTPVRLVIGYDGSRHSDAAIKAVAARKWPVGSEARILVCLDLFMGTVPPWALQEMISRSEGKSAEGTQGITEGLKHLVDQTAVSLRNTGLNVETHIRESDPRTALVQEAECWSADCIFVGARGLGRFERFLLGSVSTAVTTRAACSVEIVRTA